MCVCGEGELRQERIFRFIPNQQRMLCSQWKSLSEVYGFWKEKKERKKELELKHAERFFFFFLILYWICCNIASTPCLCFLAEGHARGVPAPQPWTEPAKSQPLDHKESPQSASWGVGRWGVRLSMGFRVFREALSPWNISDRTIWGVEVEGTGTT